MLTRNEKERLEILLGDCLEAQEGFVAAFHLSYTASRRDELTKRYVAARKALYDFIEKDLS